MVHLTDVYISSKVEKAIAKGLLLSRTNPSLAIYKQTLALLHAKFAYHQQNYKFSRTLLKRITGARSGVSGSFSWITYTAYLTSISYALQQKPPDIPTALSAVEDLASISQRRGDLRMSLLCHVLRLRMLVDAGMWQNVGEALLQAESALGLSYDQSPRRADGSPAKGSPAKGSPAKGSSSTGSPEKSRVIKEQIFIMFDDPLEVSMVLHVLIMGIVYYTHGGNAAAASPRLSHLHALLDSDALSKFPEGVVDASILSHVAANLRILISALIRLSSQIPHP